MRGCVIEREERGDMDILHLDGSLDAYSFPRLEATLNDLREKKRNRVVLECAHLEYISSAALGALIGFARRAREDNGDLKLAQLSPKIFNIVELLGFHKILEIFKSTELAAEKFGGQGNA